jgi:hypothetical protein
MPFPVTPSQKEKAVQYLLDNIPSNTWGDIAKEMDEKGSNWWVMHHHGFGIGIRNLLRKGKFIRGSIYLDEAWIELFEEAVTKKFDK